MLTHGASAKVPLRIPSYTVGRVRTGVERCRRAAPNTLGWREMCAQSREDDADIAHPPAGHAGHATHGQMQHGQTQHGRDCPCCDHEGANAEGDCCDHMRQRNQPNRH